MVVAARAPDRRGCDTRGLRAELLRAPGAAQPNPVSTHEPGSGTCGEPAKRVWEKRDSRCRQAGLSGLSDRAQIRDPTPSPSQGGAGRDAALSPALPLHVGVLQCPGCAKPLLRGKYQESPEEIQGLRGCVWRQEGVQRLPWPAGARVLSPLQVGAPPHIRIRGSSASDPDPPPSTT